MVTVDSKGRVVLPKEVRNRLGIAPGTEVEIREENGKAVVEPEDDPGRIVDDLERLDGVATEIVLSGGEFETLNEYLGY